ncbi:MAG TPA: HigA family addiction module antitoxin [Chthoniobacteraceae bacterium]|nr:HigA family addiction module antitoxin [Chthoniobacteraceae bacterium]
MADRISLDGCRSGRGRDRGLPLEGEDEVAKRLPPVHPGEVLREEFLLPMRLSAYAVARACGVPRTRIERLAREETPVTADTALRLARYFGTTPEFWMGMQAQHDLERAEDDVAAELRRIEPLRRKAA